MGWKGFPFVSVVLASPGRLLVFTQVSSIAGIHIYLRKIDSRKMYPLTHGYSIFGNAGYT